MKGKEREMKKMQPITERINRELLREAANYIEENPNHFDQGDFGDDDRYYENLSDNVMCNTPCCIAGIIGLIKGYRLNSHESVRTFARKQLNITMGESDQLFDPVLGSRLTAIVRPESPKTNLTPDPIQAVTILRALADNPEPLQRKQRRKLILSQQIEE